MISEAMMPANTSKTSKANEKVILWKIKSGSLELDDLFICIAASICVLVSLIVWSVLGWVGTADKFTERTLGKDYDMTMTEKWLTYLIIFWA